MSALRFHPCNLPSIVQDYYQLLNYSDDIYQGQLYWAVSCRENGQSVLLLHSHAWEFAAEAVQVERWKHLVVSFLELLFTFHFISAVYFISFGYHRLSAMKFLQLAS